MRATELVLYYELPSESWTSLCDMLIRIQPYNEDLSRVIPKLIGSWNLSLCSFERFDFLLLHFGHECERTVVAY